MAGPVPAYQQLPDASAFTGKLNRTQSRVIGGHTVADRFIQIARQAQLLGVYEAQLAQQTVSATAQDGVSTTQGFLWAGLPTTISNVKARLRLVNMTMNHSTVLVASTAPRIKVDRYTFTGAGTATPTVNGVRKICSGPSTSRLPYLDLRTNMTGMVVSLVGGSCGVMPIGGDLTAIGAYAPAQHGIISPYELEGGAGEDGFIALIAGEGVSIYQDVAGTAADTRKFSLGLVWDEIDVA